MFSKIFRKSFSSFKNLPNVNNLKIHYPEGYNKVFKIPYNASTQQVVDLIRSEETNAKDINIFYNEEDYTKNDVPFIDLVLHNSPNLVVDGINYSYELDLTNTAPYYQHSDLEESFREHEVPYFDAVVVARFHSLLKQNLSDKQLYTPQELKSAIQKTLSQFSDENAEQSSFWSVQSQIQENLDKTVQYYAEIYHSVQSKAHQQGHRLLKRLIIFALVQYFFLMYLTYGLYSWNVSEPISYLLAISMETVALFYFLRRGQAFRQTHLYKEKFEETFQKLINKQTNSTNFVRDFDFARRKADFLQAKILYGCTSVAKK
ncbi:hypothetical protein pb186bvf_004276 [Paramecium bursaria]